MLYELLISSKIRLAISIIKSTFHPKLPSAISANFYTKLGYAAIIHRKQKTAKKHFEKALAKAQSSSNEQVIFSVNLALSIMYFFDCDYKQCKNQLLLCEQNEEYAGQEKAHFFNTKSLYYLYTGDFERSMTYSDKCIEECSPEKLSIGKELFLCTALQLKGVAFLSKNDVDNAKKYCERSLYIANRSGYSRCVRLSKAYLAGVCAYRKELDLAIKLTDESLKGVEDNDISVPTLICAAICVNRIADNISQTLELHEKLTTICTTPSAPVTFSLYQLLLLYQQQQDHSNIAKTQEKITESLNVLGLNYWNNIFLTMISKGRMR